MLDNSSIFTSLEMSYTLDGKAKRKDYPTISCDANECALSIDIFISYSK